MTTEVIEAIQRLEHNPDWQMVKNNILAPRLARVNSELVSTEKPIEHTRRLQGRAEELLFITSLQDNIRPDDTDTVERPETDPFDF